ncbi:MAG: GNAT family N-acetyltransferase [Streptosporangiaceae bacterium]
MTMSLRRRPITPDDAAAWAVLIAEIQDADGSDYHVSEQDLREEFDSPNMDFARGSIAIWDGRTMAGCAVLACRNAADPVHNMRQDGGVHPAYRGRGLGGDLLGWAEQAAVPLHEERFPGHPLALSSGVFSRNTGAIALHEERGYQAVRWFHSMIRDLSAPIPEAVIPDGVRIAGHTADQAEAALLVRNESFRDHWGSTEVTEQNFAHSLALRAFRQRYSYLAYEGPTPLGLILSHEYDAYNTKTGRRDLYIAIVGTRAAGRKRGIATALLVTAMSAARADGYDQASLAVDADSLTGAVGLYQHVGFAVDTTWITFQKQLT